MYVITYSLRENENNPDLYYRDIAIFTDEILLEVKNLFQNVLSNFTEYVKDNGSGVFCSKEEYSLDLLTLGIMWQIYSGDASGLDEIPRQLLIGLSKYRSQGGKLKPGIDEGFPTAINIKQLKQVLGIEK